METKQIKLPVKGAELEGELMVNDAARGLVLFAHGSGSSRHSPRNQYVAQTLRQAGLGTLLVDLLTYQEERAETYTRHLRFNIPFLADRLSSATGWVLREFGDQNLSLGYFGSSTGAAAALVAASEQGGAVAAVVSRGGRPDLAGAALERVRAATLLIVGGDDLPVIPLNQEAYARLTCKKALKIVPRASHLFEEPGTLETVARMASDWFSAHLCSSIHHPGQKSGETG